MATIGTWILTQFMSLVSFRCFLIFSGGMERDQWHEMRWRVYNNYGISFFLDKILYDAGFNSFNAKVAVI